MKSRKWVYAVVQGFGLSLIITGMIILWPYSLWFALIGFGVLGAGLLLEPEPVDGEKIDAA